MADNLHRHHDPNPATRPPVPQAGPPSSRRAKLQTRGAQTDPELEGELPSNRRARAAENDIEILRLCIMQNKRLAEAEREVNKSYEEKERLAQQHIQYQNSLIEKLTVTVQESRALAERFREEIAAVKARNRAAERAAKRSRSDNGVDAAVLREKEKVAALRRRLAELEERLAKKG